MVVNCFYKFSFAVLCTRWISVSQTNIIVWDVNCVVRHSFRIQLVFCFGRIVFPLKPLSTVEGSFAIK